MAVKNAEVTSFINALPEGKRELLSEFRKTILKNLPKGFEEAMSYGMVGYVVPHKLFPAGYHCDPKLPLPFLTVAIQKNFAALYHMGMYFDAELLKWFSEAVKKETGKKPDMGKSCIRFKKPEEIPFALLGKLVAKMGAKEYVALYEKTLKKGK